MACSMLLKLRDGNDHVGGPPGSELFRQCHSSFTVSDGVQTFTNHTATTASFFFATDPSGVITEWSFAILRLRLRAKTIKDRSLL